MYTVYVVNRMKTRMETCVKTQNTTPNTTQNGKRADMYEKKVLLYSSCIIVLEQKNEQICEKVFCKNKSVFVCQGMFYESYLCTSEEKRFVCKISIQYK